MTNLYQLRSFRIAGGFLATLFLVTASVSCGSAAGIDAESRSELFGAAAAHRIFVDNTFGGQDVFDDVSIVSTVGLARDDGLTITVVDDSRALTQDERLAIRAALAPKTVTFVPFGTSPTSGVDRLEAMLSFAEPVGGTDEAVVATSLVCWGSCGAGGAQRFERTPDGWHFVENAGPQWVS